MANDEHPAWSAGEPYAAVGGSAMPEDDFANFLDLDNIDFNFAGLDASAYSAATPENGDAQKFSSYDHSDNDPRRIHPAGLGVGDMPMVTDGSSHQGYPAYTHNHNGQYQWQANGQYHSHHSVPPTPNSSEMYPTPYHQQTGAGPQYHRERQSYNHKDDSVSALDYFALMKITDRCSSLPSHPHNSWAAAVQRLSTTTPCGTHSSSAL